MPSKPTKKQLDLLWKRGDLLAIAEACILASEPGNQVNSPGPAYERLKSYGLKRQEYFLVVTLDGAHQIINVHEASKGLVNRTVVHPREVFRPAILDSAVSILIAHNHPSGRLEPSPEDLDITRRLREAGELIGIDVVDHLILGRTSYLSMLERGLIPPSSPS